MDVPEAQGEGLNVLLILEEGTGRHKEASRLVQIQCTSAILSADVRLCFPMYIKSRRIKLKAAAVPTLQPF